MWYSILFQIVNRCRTFFPKSLTCVDITTQVTWTHCSTQSTCHSSGYIFCIDLLLFFFESKWNCWRLDFLLYTCSVSMGNCVWYWCSLMFSLLIIFVTNLLGANLDFFLRIIIKIDRTGFTIFILSHFDWFFGVFCC